MNCPDCGGQKLASIAPGHLACSECGWAEQLNEPTGPTQMQIDRRFITKLMLVIGECHYAVNRSSPGMATDNIRRMITELKGDPEWKLHFKRMGSQASDGVEHDR